MSQLIRETAQKLILAIGTALIPNFVLGQPANISAFIDKKIQNMTVDEKVGQLFIVGFPHRILNQDLENFLKKNKPGSYLLFKRNIVSLEQVKKLNDQLYRLSYKLTQLPPLVAIDQEGGSVSRLPIFPAPPNALAIGKTSSAEFAKEMGLRTGLFLREVGINMNLAPVLDLANPEQDSFIGARAFGDDPDLVAKLGTAYSEGLVEAHVVPTAKHFPGSGSSNLDPHLTVVSNQKSAAELRRVDMKPFVDYTKLGSRSAMMLSHLIYPSLDPAKEPASFSKAISHDILRTELKYQGLVMTDDLQMQGSKKLLRPEFAALKALQAGADLVMLTWSFADQERAIQFVKQAVENGELSKADLHAKLKRILTTKAFANTYRRDPNLPSLITDKKLSSKEYGTLENQILQHNLNEQVEKSQELRRPATTGQTICATSPSRHFIEQLKDQSKIPIKTSLFRPKTPAKKYLQWSQKESCDVQIFTVTGKQSARFIQGLPRNIQERLIVVNLGAPYLVKSSETYFKVIQLYFNHQEAGKSIAQILPELLTQSLASNSPRAF